MVVRRHYLKRGLTYRRAEETAHFVRHFDEPARPTPATARDLGIDQLADSRQRLVAGGRSAQQLDAFFVRHDALAKVEMEEIERHDASGTNASHNRKYLANSATQEKSCEFGYLSATCRSARARFLSPIDGANHNATTPSGRRASGGISRPSAFALGCQSALYSRTARSSDVQAIEHRQAHRLLLAGFAFDFVRKITTP